MNRVHPQSSLFSPKLLGMVIFTLLMAFVAYKILTPPHEEVERLESPDGTKTARLRRYFLYDNNPSYRIQYRETGKPFWQSLSYLPAYTNVPPEDADPSLAWTSDSTRLDFLMNGTSIWHRVFTEE